jgi:DNA-binding beta-propeller fold protein YncE
VSTVAGSGATGSRDGTNSVAQFNSPADVGVDQSGNLFVTDQFNHTIRKITPVGPNWAVTTIGGAVGKFGSANGIGTAAQFNKPWGLAVQADGRLFIADRSNHSVRQGVPASSVPPLLSIRLDQANVVLSWPLSASGFTLETSSAPSNGATWTRLTNGVVISANSFVLSQSLSAGPAFYRLHSP